MKIERIKKSDFKKEELYQVGNIIEFYDEFYLVAKVSDDPKYVLIDLKTGLFASTLFDDLKELANQCYTSNDKLVSAKLIIND